MKKTTQPKDTLPHSILYIMLALYMLNSAVRDATQEDVEYLNKLTNEQRAAFYSLTDQAMAIRESLQCQK